MYLYKKWHLLFSCLILLRITKTITQCIFSIVINVLKEIEFTLESCKTTTFSHRTFSRIERDSIKNHGSRSTRTETSYSVDLNSNPSYAKCVIYNLPVGKYVTVKHLNRHEVETNITDITCEGIVEETNGMKTSQESTKISKMIMQIIKESRSKYSEASTSHIGDALKDPSANKLLKSVSLNVPQEIVKNNIESSAPNAFRQPNMDNEYKAKQSEKQHLQDSENKFDLHKTKQNALQYDSNGSDGLLDGDRAKNSIMDDVVGDKKDIIFSETSKILEQEQNLPSSAKLKVNKTLLLNAKTVTEDAKVDDDITPCVDTEKEDTTVVKKDVVGKSDSTKGRDNAEDPSHSGTDNIVVRRPPPSQELWKDLLEKGSEAYIEFLRENNDALNDIEKEITNLYEMYFYMSLTESEQVEIVQLQLQLIQSKFKDLERRSVEINSHPYHGVVIVYRSEMCELINQTIIYIQQNKAHLHGKNRTTFMKEETRSAVRKRIILYEANDQALALGKVIQKTGKVPPKKSQKKPKRNRRRK